jgi:hypothetical protein
LLVIPQAVIAGMALPRMMERDPPEAKSENAGGPNCPCAPNLSQIAPMARAALA